MEQKPTEFYEKSTFDFTNISDQSERLEAIIKANIQIADNKALYHNDLERAERDLMKNPLSNEIAFGRFGLLLGTFAPMTLFASYIYEISKNSNQANIGVIVTFLIFINFICASAGYLSGKAIVSKLVEKAEKFSWNSMILLMPLIGILWGIITGGIGGFFIFIIGAVFGAIIASVVGSVALTVFTVFHRWLKRGDSIEQKHFLPLAFGITATICAFILGLARF